MEHANLPHSRRRRDVFFSLFLFHSTSTSLDDRRSPARFSSNHPNQSKQNAEGGGEFYSEWEETAESFDQMGLHENLLRGIYAVSLLDAERLLTTSKKS